jgi:hypothetical protein
MMDEDHTMEIEFYVAENYRAKLATNYGGLLHLD